jgi:hypothetical protein
MVEEYLGVDREKFVKEIVKTHAILDAAINMWYKKERNACDMYVRGDIGLHDEMMNMDEFYIGMFDLYTDGVDKYDREMYRNYGEKRSDIYNTMDIDMTNYAEEHDTSSWNDWDKGNHDSWDM